METAPPIYDIPGNGFVPERRELSVPELLQTLSQQQEQQIKLLERIARLLDRLSGAGS